MKKKKVKSMPGPLEEYLNGGPRKLESEALLRAAPELLAALKGLVASLGIAGPCDVQANEKLQAEAIKAALTAIFKAEGRTL